MAKKSAFFQIREKTVGRRWQALAAYTIDPPNIFEAVIYKLIGLARHQAGWPRAESMWTSNVYRCPSCFISILVLGPQSRFGDKSLEIRMVCPQIGTAVL